jgi:hypothetical protein
VCLKAGLAALAIYLIMIVFRAFKNRQSRPVPEMIAYYTVIDVLNLFYFFTFFPKDKKEVYAKYQNQP